MYLSLHSWSSRRTVGGAWGSGRTGRTTGRTALSGMSGCCSFSASLQGRKEKRGRERERWNTSHTRESSSSSVYAGLHGICLSVCWNNFWGTCLTRLSVGPGSCSASKTLVGNVVPSFSCVLMGLWTARPGICRLFSKACVSRLVYMTL